MTQDKNMQEAENICAKNPYGFRGLIDDIAQALSQRERETWLAAEQVTLNHQCDFDSEWECVEQIAKELRKRGEDESTRSN